MPIQFSPVIAAQQRALPGFSSLLYVDLDKLGVAASPVAVLDDFRVPGLPFSPHPHAGFAAVTYVFEDSPGGLRSRASTGVDLLVGAGGIVWTEAGSGGLANAVSFFGMFGWNPWVALNFLAGAAPDGAAREKPGLPPTLGGL